MGAILARALIGDRFARHRSLAKRIVEFTIRGQPAAEVTTEP
jgi:hypothetical protein